MDGRRALADAIRNELLATTTTDELGGGCCTTEEEEEEEEEGTMMRNLENHGRRVVRRRVYALSGHGVPPGLLRHLCDAARGWLGMRRRKRQRQSSPTATVPNDDDRGDDGDGDDDDDGGGGGGDDDEGRMQRDRISFSNVPNSTLLDRDRIISIVVDHPDGTTATALTLASLPEDWEHDLEMYMVVMDRMGSRLTAVAMAAMAASSLPPPTDAVRRAAVDIYGDGGGRRPPDGGDDSGDGAGLDTTGTTTAGSIVVPSRLRGWDVTIARGGASPSPSPGGIPTARRGEDRRGGGGEGRSRDRGGGGRRDGDRAPTLSLEWARRTGDRWRVVLRLHDRGGGGCGEENDVGGMSRSEDDVLLTFEGEYVPP